VNVTATPPRVWQRANSPANPYQSQIKATVNFNFNQDTDSLPGQIGLWLSGCDFPPSGPQDNVPVQWELTDELPAHGSLTQSDVQTWMGGQARATYQANDEPVPEVLRSFLSPKAAIGYVRVRVMNVLPQYPNLVAVVRAANPNLAAADAALTVYYYQWPQLTLDLDSELAVNNVSGRIIASGVALQLVESGQGTSKSYVYQGHGQETYVMFHWPDPDVQVVSHEGGQFQATIPVQANATAGTLQVVVDIGLPLETLQWTDPPRTVTSSWFGGTFRIAHTGDLVQSSPPRFGITGWQAGPGAATLVRRYSGSGSGGVTETTTFTLTVIPAR
jgi:hypothetical protein